MKQISWEEFTSIEIRVGSIVDVQDFPDAHQPAYKIWADFGDDIGLLKTSAQITHLYTAEELIGMQILGVVNLPPKQIGTFVSQFLLTGFQDNKGRIVIAQPERPVEPGALLH